MKTDPRIVEAEEKLGRKLNVEERAAVEQGAEVIKGRIVCSSAGGKVSEARK